MADFPLTSAFLKVIEETAHKNNARRITKLWLTFGRGAVFKGNVSAYLEYILRGTAARDAEIYIRHGYTAGRCRCCGLVFSNETASVCPECGSIADSIFLDKRFIIDVMEIER